MYKHFLTIILSAFLGFSATSQDTDCLRFADFGSIDIYIAPVAGYIECYQDSLVKELADGTEAPINQVLAFYLNEKTHENKDSFLQIGFDDYFKIYATKQLQDYPADEALLTEMEQIIKSNFLVENWDLIKEEVDEIGLEIEMTQPTIIQSYNLNDRSFSMIMLMTYEQADMDSFTMAMTVNGILQNERLIWMAYYLQYKGEETIQTLKQKSDKILSQIMNKS